MKYNELPKGYVIKYKFIKDERLQFAESPPLDKTELETRLKEMKYDEVVQEIVVSVVRYYKK